MRASAYVCCVHMCICVCLSVHTHECVRACVCVSAHVHVYECFCIGLFFFFFSQSIYQSVSDCVCAFYTLMADHGDMCASTCVSAGVYVLCESVCVCVCAYACYTLMADHGDMCAGVLVRALACAFAYILFKDCRVSGLPSNDSKSCDIHLIPYILQL